MVVAVNHSPTIPCSCRGCTPLLLCSALSSKQQVATCGCVTKLLLDAVTQMSSRLRCAAGWSGSLAYPRRPFSCFVFDRDVVGNHRHDVLPAMERLDSDPSRSHCQYTLMRRSQCGGHAQSRLPQRERRTCQIDLTSPVTRSRGCEVPAAPSNGTMFPSCRVMKPIPN